MLDLDIKRLIIGTMGIEHPETITELSNKIAFFYNGHKLITIHRSQFSFLETVKKDYKSPEEILVYLIHKMVETYQIPLNELDEKIIQIEKTIFLKDYSKVSLEDLYFLKAQTRITKGFRLPRHYRWLYQNSIYVFRPAKIHCSHASGY